MKQVHINIKSEIEKLLPKTLTKDLQEYEVLCPTCNGLGIGLIKSPYGVKDDDNPNVRGIRFPYANDSIGNCNDCYGGVRTICKYCSKLLDRGIIGKCDCRQYIIMEAKVKLANWTERFNKATEVKEKDIDTMLYCEEIDGYFHSTDEFIEEWENYNNDEPMPQILWITEQVDIHIDADDVIESACDDLHENAIDNCDNESLQKMLDEWCKKATGATTYYPYYNEYVIVEVDNNLKNSDI